MRKNTIKTIMVALVLLVVSLYFITGTYARYYEEFTGDTKANIAKWAVALKDGSDQTLTSIQNVQFVVDPTNANVVNGKIAPAVTLKGTIKLDLTGTEVNTEYKAVVDKTAIATAFGDSASAVTVSVSGATENTFVTATGFSTANGYTGTDAVKTIDITITWNNVEANNTSDTSVGKTKTSVTLPVTLTARQIIAGS